MLIILVLVTACGRALCAFRHGEPSRAQPNFVSKYIRTHSHVEQR